MRRGGKGGGWGALSCSLFFSPESAAGVDDQVLRPAAQVHHRHRAEVERVEHEVAVADGVHRVWADPPPEAEVERDRAPVDAERVPRERAAPQRQRLDAREQVAQPLRVALPRRRVREQPVRPAHDLGRLQVGEPGHDDVGLGLGSERGGAEQLAEVDARLLAKVAGEPEPRVGGDLFFLFFFRCARAGVGERVSRGPLRGGKKRGEKEGEEVSKRLTWSFLDLPVCSFPPTAPISSVSLRSLAVWMSSSPALISKVPALHSAATASNPATISAASPSVSTAVFERARA